MSRKGNWKHYTNLRQECQSPKTVEVEDTNTKQQVMWNENRIHRHLLFPRSMQQQTNQVANTIHLHFNPVADDQQQLLHWNIVETQIENHRSTEKTRDQQITATFQSFTSDVKDQALSCQSNSDEKQCVIYPTISGPQEFEGHLLMSFKDSEAKLPGS